MYILFTLFFISLIGMIVMFSRKLSTIEDVHLLNADYTHPFVPDIEKLKVIAIEKTKKYGHATIVIALRTHIKSKNFLKGQYDVVVTKIREIRGVPYNVDEAKAEVSGFLKMISEYKHKIRDIKHKIHEEENNL